MVEKAPVKQRLPYQTTTTKNQEIGAAPCDAAYTNECINFSLGSHVSGKNSASCTISMIPENLRVEAKLHLRASALEGALRANAVDKKTDILKTAEAFYEFMIS